MAEDSLKDEMLEQLRAQRERYERRDPRRTVLIEAGAHPAHAEVPAAEVVERRGFVDRLLRRR